ncbi:FAD synthetase, putative [Hepatocystis sp. ex Piliocolobus tephrosceles]|nr:FAD synthetase, putative [Hepatocystis sp. ex Piliocolobus tephrosceles]
MMATENFEIWKDYSNALRLYEKIQNLYDEYKKNKINDNSNSSNSNVNKEISSKCGLIKNVETKKHISLKNHYMIKPSMYNYNVINYYKDDCMLKTKIMELSKDIIDAINQIYDTFRLCNDNVFLSFNGGKDAVVVLHLFRCAYAKYIKDTKGKIKKPNLCYFKDHTNEFPEVYQFLNECVYIYDFNIHIIKGTWKEGINNFINELQQTYKNDSKLCFNNTSVLTTPSTTTSTCNSNTSNTNICTGNTCTGNICTDNTFTNNTLTITFINGTRYVDNFDSKMQTLNISSKGLLPYLYANPIYYWTYGAVWTFILYFKFDYCILYDHGYSSIGTINDTIKNEFLKCNDCYLPAYFLKNWDYERHNRVFPPQKKKKAIN